MALVGMTFGARWHSNPQVQQGASASFSKTGTDSPSGSNTWDIINSSSQVKGSSGTPNGWNVTYSAPTFTVTAPANATIATNYEVRYTSGGGNGGGGDIVVQTQGTSASAKFDVIAGSQSPAPTGLTATPGNQQAVLTWNSVSNATSYIVKRSTTSGSGYTTIATGITSPTYTNTGLTNFTTYYYVVCSVNGFGTSGNSGQASATPPGPPPAPANLAVYAGNQQLHLVWSGQGTGVTYNVSRCLTVNGTFVTIASGLTNPILCDSPLTNGTTYYYEVSATNSIGTGPSSSAVSGVPSALASELAVTNINETAAHVVTVSLTANVPAPWTVTSSQTVNGVTYNSTTGFAYYVASSVMTITVPSGDVSKTFTAPSIPSGSATGPMVQTGDEVFTMNSPPGGGTTKAYVLLDVQTTTTWTQNGNQMSSSGGFDGTDLEQDYSLVQLLPTVTTIDSRKSYGQPNQAGEVAGDANAPLRNVLFYSWPYKGGLYVGNTIGTSDASGTARIEAQVTQTTNFVDPLWSCFTVAYLGHPTTFATDYALNLASPNATDNFGVDITQATWATAWNLSTATYYTSISTSGLSAYQYVNFQGIGYHPRVILALANESSLVSAGATTWSYFANPSWASSTGLMAIADATPRLWVIDLTGHNP